MQMVLNLLALGWVAVSTGTAPTLVQIDGGAVASAFRIDPTYRASSNSWKADMRVVNAYAIDLPTGTRLIAAASSGFLPMNIKLDDGRCYEIKADYEGGRFINGSIGKTVCGSFSRPDIGGPRIAPHPGLRFINRAWGFDAWRNDRTGETFVTNTFRDGSPVVLTTTMDVLSINAMRSPDAPLADISFVGQLHGQPSMVTIGLTF